jgi:hypothetical protein
MVAVVPGWAGAAWLDRDQLALYIGVRVDRIPKLLREGKLPTPSYHLGPKQPRYRREEVDALFEGAGASCVGERGARRVDGQARPYPPQVGGEEMVRIVGNAFGRKKRRALALAHGEQAAR